MTPSEPMQSIDPATRLGAIRLTVSALDRAREFYETAIGLTATELPDGTLGLVAPGAAPIVELCGDSAAPPLRRRDPGLFHLAILLPTRQDLARSLGRLAQAGWPLDGASDHLVSEALYLSDPDGNGIELYRDRPRSRWPGRDGKLQMDTLPLDLDDLLGELTGIEPLGPRVPAGTSIGHVHLQVSELRDVERFYVDVLGFAITVASYPGALFVSAGRYHHHIGLNTWHSAAVSAPDRGAVGLRSYDVVLPDDTSLQLVLERIRDAGLPTEATGQGAILVRDPSGNGVVLRSSRLEDATSTVATGRGTAGPIAA